MKTLIKNPSKEQFLSLLDKSHFGSLRALVYGKDSWIWDAAYQTHFGMAANEGIPYQNASDARIEKKGDDILLSPIEMHVRLPFLNRITIKEGNGRFSR